MSLIASASDPFRLVAMDSKATHWPLAEIDALNELELPFAPAMPSARDASTVDERPRTKTSEIVSASAPLRLVAVDWKDTNLPSAEIMALKLGLFAWTPPAPTDRRTLTPVETWRRKMSRTPLLSPRMMSVESDS